MIVKCISTSLTDEQQEFIGAPRNYRTKYQLIVGKHYLVLGITVLIRSPILGSGPIFAVQDEFGACAEAPACLFTIVDDRLSTHWRVHQHENLTLTLWPDEFYGEFFHEKLADRDPSTTIAFERVVKRLAEEFPALGLGKNSLSLQ
jgi:hypothetical protein